MADFYIKKRKFLSFLLFLLCWIFSCVSFTACQQKIDYYDYVSELRSNILLAEDGDFSLRVHALIKESPYAMDGIPKSPLPRMEAYLVAPNGTNPCHLSFSYEEKNYSGEMSYDNVKGEYFFSHSLDVSEAKELLFEVQYGEEIITLRALSIKTENLISPRKALSILEESEKELFLSLTDKYGFSAEIYLRLIYEGSPYYYVGIIERNGNVHAFLIHAQTGKILAKRRP